MKITKEIYCVNKDNKGIIEKVGVVSDVDKSKYTPKKKEDFIKEVREIENKGNEVEIKTSLGTKVHIVKDKYLRTDGDQSKDNDLLDLRSCNG